MPETRTITLVKGVHRFVLTYEVGTESQVLDQVVAWVKAGLIDGFDAAIFAHQVGVHLAKELKALPKGVA